MPRGEIYVSLLLDEGYEAEILHKWIMKKRRTASSCAWSGICPQGGRERRGREMRGGGGGGGRRRREREREEGDCFASCHRASSQQPLNASCKWGITIVSVASVRECTRELRTSGRVCLEADDRGGRVGETVCRLWWIHATLLLTF